MSRNHNDHSNYSSLQQQQQHHQSTTGQKEPIQLQKLELSLHPEDGSLLTVPLCNVVLAATDGLHNDIYNMAHGELEVTVSNQQADDGDNNTNKDEDDAIGINNASSMQQQHQTKRDRLSDLSFAQRRHEIVWRLVQHTRGFLHVAALTAASAPSNGGTTSDFARNVQISSTTLQHARSAWIQADEAQDALYFFHAQLFPARAAPHDVFGALDVQLSGQWYDLPSDVRLASVDRYEMSRESTYTRQETDERWQLAVREKLLLGEAGWMLKRGMASNVLWKLSLNGGVVKLTHGEARILGSEEKFCYPIEALLTVLSTTEKSLWTLLSLDVRVQAKTGEFNHQLETSNRQRYDLHRLAALAMTREEVRVRKMENSNENTKSNTDDIHTTADDFVARPLNALFRVAHHFSLSWQLEILSAQAQALKRGVWGSLDTNQLTVTPVRFFEHTNDFIGAVTISFWKIDDSYGSPSMGYIEVDTTENNSSNEKVKHDIVASQLHLCIRAVPDVGIKVSISGADTIMEAIKSNQHLSKIAKNMLNAASNPFALSTSDALLGAARLCAERKCHAVVRALTPLDRPSVLPSWMVVDIEKGGILFAAKISYHGIETDDISRSKYPILFRLVCDLRTGSFVSTFPRSMALLSRLASNDVTVSEALTLRLASLPQNRRRAAGANASGRVVKDTFDALIRAMNALGQRTGVGGAWDDVDDQSASLRQRSIQTACVDVCESLVRCCGIAALYGFASLSIRAATGCDPHPDMAGEAIESIGQYRLLKAPPLSILLNQEVIEKSGVASDGTTKKLCHVLQSHFALVCCADTNGISLMPLSCNTRITNPAGVLERVDVNLLVFKPTISTPYSSINGVKSISDPPTKRLKLESNGGTQGHHPVDAIEEVSNFANILKTTIDLQINE